MSFLFVVAAIVCGYLAFNGTFYTTGTQYYEACWEKLSKTEGLAEPKPSNPYQAVMWGNCEMITQRAVYSEGIVFAVMPKDQTGVEAANLNKVCPNTWTDVPMGGLYILFIQQIQSTGGPQILDKFMPAGVIIGRIAKQRWPLCSAARQQQGYPKIVEKGPGEFGWERPCLKCK